MVAFRVPFTESNQNQRYWYPFTPAANLTNTTMSIVAYAPGATGGTLSIYLSATNSAPGAGAIALLSDLSKGWQVIQLTVGGPVDQFDPAQIKQVTFEVISGAPGPWASPTTVYIDRLTFSDAGLNNTFDSSLGTFQKSSTQAVAGATLTWNASLP
jgi:hypothetical protein